MIIIIILIIILIIIIIIIIIILKIPCFLLLPNWSDKVCQKG